MQITKEWLEEVGACEDGINWFDKINETSATKLLNIAIKSNDSDILGFANWAICRKFSKEQIIKYAIFSAEQVIDIFEKKYPEDKRPRRAINTAKQYLNNQTEKNRNAAADAAYAAYAAYAAASYAADAAASNAAAAYAAAYAAYAAASNDGKRIEMKIKILNYGRELLGI